MTQRIHVSSLAFPRFLASTLLLLSLTVAGKAGTVNFSSPRDYPAGRNPQSVAVGDFNADGVLDLAVADMGDPSTGDPGGVSILLGYGDGTFRAPMSFGAGKNPVKVALADFNGDRKLSLVVLETADPLTGLANVNILLGRGDGTFQPPAAIGQAYSFVVADINGDKRSDLALDPPDRRLRILLSNGDGNFQLPIDSAAAGGSTFGDFNRDGNSDAVWVGFTPVTSETFRGVVAVQLGNGSGTFQPLENAVETDLGITSSVFSRGSAYIAAVVDLTGDGRLDLVVGVRANRFSMPTLQIFLGNGDGTFHLGGNLDPAAMSISATGDFDGDGKPDLVVRTLESGEILLGNGDGTFQTGSTTSAADLAKAAVAGDLNQDGMLDLVLNPDSVADTVSVILNLTPGFLVSASPSALTATAGGTANTTLNVAPTNGFNETVELTCSGAPRVATCSISPASVTLNGSNIAEAALTVKTTARTSALVSPWGKPSVIRKQWSRLWTAFLLGLALLMVLAARRRAARPLIGIVLAATLLLVVFWAACGGNSSEAVRVDHGTPAGIYSLTITATSGSFVQSTTVTLKVQ